MANATLKVLLGSGGVSNEERRKVYSSLVSQHFYSSEKVLFIPFASHDHSEYTTRMNEFLGEDVNLVGIHSFEDPLSALSEFDSIYVGGGNSFLLVNELHVRSLIEPIRKMVLGGASYLGVSAGANVASPTMMTTNDMPIVLPPSFESIGAVPFQINPHYHPGKIRFMDGENLVEHFGETRARRISEFHVQWDVPVLGMWEGSYVHWDGETGVLTGRATSFRAGEDPVELGEGDRFDSNLVQVL